MKAADLIKVMEDAKEAAGPIFKEERPVHLPFKFVLAILEVLKDQEDRLAELEREVRNLNPGASL